MRLHVGHVARRAGAAPRAMVLGKAIEAGRRLGGIVVEPRLFSQFKGHYRFEARFRDPHSGNEKGSVESAVGFLRRARDEGRLDREAALIGRARLLVIDELGFLPLDPDGARLLFQVFADAYERQSVVITTNLEFSRWGAVFGDDQMAEAVIDRIVHHGGSSSSAGSPTACATRSCRRGGCSRTLRIPGAQTVQK